jgi:enoyl-CoA hydratase
MGYAEYRHLAFERRANGVVIVRLDRPEVLNAMNDRLHAELARVWVTLGADPDARVVVVTGNGRAFSSGADLALLEANTTDPRRSASTFRESTELVENLVGLEKPVISAVHGVAIGAGLAVALLADISIVAENARLADGHTRVGVVAGDHAALAWPLLCGMAKAKYYLLTSEYLSGREAERIGLVSLSVPPDQVMPKALEVADRLAAGPQDAIRFTKRSLNHWLRQAAPILDASMALELLSFMGEDAREGVRAIREKRPPSFPSAAPRVPPETEGGP